MTEDLVRAAGAEVELVDEAEQLARFRDALERGHQAFKLRCVARDEAGRERQTEAGGSPAPRGGRA